jgi:hypothetical protein
LYVIDLEAGFSKYGQLGCSTQSAQSLSSNIGKPSGMLRCKTRHFARIARRFDSVTLAMANLAGAAVRALQNDDY